MDKQAIDEALAGLWDKPNPRLAVWGDLLYSKDGKPDGAEIDWMWNEQGPEPPQQEYVPK